MSALLDELVAETKAELGKDASARVDWKSVDAGLFAAIARERQAERARFEPPRRRHTWALGAAVAAAAWAALLFAGRLREPSNAVLDAVGESAGTIVAIDGHGVAGAALLDGVPAVAGAVLERGDVLDTRGARVVVERAGKVTWIAESGSRVAVTHVHGALVLGLAQGAVEAQVVPVASGEAFAVDLDGSRVAVHGTHLRVARDAADAGRAIVDLNEGVVAIGVAPREGGVVGALVNAPAHAEFAARDALGTLTQTHDPAAVRPPETSSGSLAPTPAPVPRRSSVAARGASEGRAEPRPGPGSQAAPTPTTLPSPVLPKASTAPTALPAPVELALESTVADAVRACMAVRPRADNVTIVVRTTLRLELTDDGSVRAALFDPPVAPDVNACAASAIYKAKFAHGDGGALTIPIDFTY